MTHQSSKAAAPLTFVVFSFIVSQAFASGFLDNNISTSLQGSAMAGAAVANEDVSAMFINPAVLATLKKGQVYIGGSEVIPKLSLSNGQANHTFNVPGVPSSSISSAVTGNSTQNNIAHSSFLPAIYFAWRLNDKLNAGISVLSPFNYSTSYDSHSVFRYSAVDTRIESVNVHPAISYQLNSQWSIAGGLQAQLLKLTLSNFNGVITGTASTDTNLPSNSNADGYGYGVTLGALYQPNTSTIFGIGFRSKISTKINGQTTQYYLPGEIVSAPSKVFMSNSQSSFNTAINTPNILTLSSAHNIDNWSIKGTLEVNFWHALHALTLSSPNSFAESNTLLLNWKNTLFAALGAEYKVSSKLTGRGGVGFDQSPIKKTSSTARFAQGDRLLVNMGLSYVFTKKLSFDAAYSHTFIQNKTIDITASSGQSETSTRPLEVNEVSGKFKGAVDALSMALRYKF